MHPDRRVTFGFVPQAKSVWVKCVAVGYESLKHDFNRRMDIHFARTRSSRVLLYAFVVDDTRFLDPANAYTRAIAGFSMGAFMRATFQRPIRQFRLRRLVFRLHCQDDQAKSPIYKDFDGKLPVNSQNLPSFIGSVWRG